MSGSGTAGRIHRGKGEIRKRRNDVNLLPSAASVESAELGNFRNYDFVRLSIQEFEMSTGKAARELHAEEPQACANFENIVVRLER